MYVLLICVADIYVVLAERKLTSYVYAVDKQPMSNNWYKMEERGGATVKCGNDDCYAFCFVNILFNVTTSLFTYRLYAR